MAISKNLNSLKEFLNNLVKPGNVADALRAIDLGSVLMSRPTTLRRKAPAADPSALASVVVVKLPEDAKAASVVRATGIAGTVTGEFSPVAFGTTPATTQVAVTPSGDIAFLGTDAPTSVDLVYVPEDGDVAEFVLPVVSNVLTLPASVSAGTVLLQEAEALVGTSTGRKVVLAPGAAAPAAGQARLNVAKTTVTFASADAVTSARVKVTAKNAVDVQAALSAVSPFAP